MAQIDSSIYLKQEAPDILGGYERGLKMRDMVEQRNKQKAVDKAFQAGMVQNPDGTTTFDKGKTLSQLAREAGGKEYLNAKTQFAQMDADEMRAKKEKSLFDADLVARYASGVKDQQTYEMAMNDLSKQGVDTSTLPKQYDPNLVRSYEMRALTTKDRLENDLKEKELVSRALDRKESRDERRFQAGIKIDEKKKKADFEASPEGRLTKLNSGDKARFDNSTLGLQAIQGMDQALKNGDNTFSLIGDNDYTLNLDRSAEAFGRMQSGGAINKDEEARFKRMAPTITDSKEVQRTKLLNMQKLYVDRLRTLGFSPEEAGVQQTEIAYGKEQASPQDDEARRWAQNNPEDPRAKKIMERLSPKMAGK